MALVTCPECGKQISTAAASCPNCGMVMPAGTVTGAAPAAGFAFTPSAARPPEKTLWEGTPSLALVYGKILGIIARAIVVYLAAFLIVDYALPALASTSSDMKSLINTNESTIAWVIFGIFTILLIPP